MVKGRKDLVAILALVSATAIGEPAQAADMYAIRLCEQIQGGDRPGATSSLEALDRIGISDVGLDGYQFSVAELLSVVRDGRPAPSQMALAMSSLNTVSLLQGDYVHAIQDCPTPSMSGGVSALLNGTYANPSDVTNGDNRSGGQGAWDRGVFPVGSEG